MFTMASSKKNTAAFIIETSAVLFLKHGFDGTSLSMLTKATGLTKGAIYGNFKDKTDLAKACFTYSFSSVEDTLRQLLDAPNPPSAAVRAFFAYYRSYDKVIAQLGSCPLVSFGIHSSHNSPQLLSLVNDGIKRIEGYLTETLKRGVEQHEIYLGIPETVFSKQLFALIQGGVSQSLITGDMKYLKNTASYLEYLFESSTRR